MPPEGRRASRAIGVYDAAMNTKIIEWSRCFMTRRARSDQRPRWYAALTP